jgi:hypothetical protein
MLTRDTILLTRKFTKIHLGTLLDNYGPYVLAKLIPTAYIFYHEKSAVAHKMSRKVLNAGSRNMLNGRPLHHINKSTGYLKTMYKKYPLLKTLTMELANIERFYPAKRVCDAIILIQYYIKRNSTKRNKSAITIQKYVRRFITNVCKIKAQRMIDESIDFTCDCITTEPLNDPCIILPDYNNGNCVIYNKSSIIQMAKTYNIPVFTYFNENTQTEEYIYRTIIERDIFHNVIYRSPYTRREFIMNEVLPLKQNLIYKFGKAITLYQSRTCYDKTT